MKKHILLIDDDEDEIEIFTDALEKLPVSFNCTCASNADEAIRMLGKVSPDFIFIDYNMPKVNGLKCLEKIKKTKTARDIPVILYSNYIDEEVNKKTQHDQHPGKKAKGNSDEIN